LDRRLLRYASVQGPSFTDELLRRCLPDAADLDAAAWRRLDEFVDASATGARHFRHALFRDVAYEGLAFERRRKLHQRVAEAEEARAGSTADDIAELLSLHFSLAGVHAKTWRYSRIAGDRARAKYANVDAAQFYTRALAAAPSLDVPTDVLAETWEKLGDVAELAAHYDQAREAYRNAGRLTSGAEADARILQKSGELRERLGRYEDAIRWYDRGLRRGEEVPRRADRMRRHMHLCLARAGVEYRLGRFAGCVEWAARAEADAEVLHNNAGLGHAYLLLHLAHVFAGNPERTEYRGRAIPLLDQAGEFRLLGNAYNNLGVDAYFEGDWAAALEYHQVGAGVRERAGDVGGLGASLVNKGEIKSDQGHYDEAGNLLDRALAIAVGTGYTALKLASHSYRGRLAARQGHFTKARAILQQGLREARKAGADDHLREIRTRLAELAVFEGDPAQVERLARPVIAAADVRDVHQSTLHRVLGYARAQQHDCGGAREELETALERAREGHSLFDAALALEALARVARRCAEPSHRYESEARAIFKRLGVVHTPEVPLDADATIASLSA
jgi:tetratricopeptide (TPR) repeat protein